MASFRQLKMQATPASGRQVLEDTRFRKVKKGVRVIFLAFPFWWVGRPFPTPFRFRDGAGCRVCVRYANVATWLFYLLGVVGLVPEPDGTSGSGTTPSTSWGSQNLRFGATKQPAKIYKDFTIYLHNCDIVMVKYYQNLDDGSSGRTESERANSE